LAPHRGEAGHRSDQRLLLLPECEFYGPDVLQILMAVADLATAPDRDLVEHGHWHPVNREAELAPAAYLLARFQVAGTDDCASLITDGHLHASLDVVVAARARTRAAANGEGAAVEVRDRVVLRTQQGERAR
jgi:hypothetical protein